MSAVRCACSAWAGAGSWSCSPGSSSGASTLISPTSWTRVVRRRSSALMRTEKCSSRTRQKSRPKKNSVEAGEIAPMASVTLRSSENQMRDQQGQHRGDDPQERVLLLELAPPDEVDDEHQQRDGAADGQDADADVHQARSPRAAGRSRVTRIDRNIL